MMEQLEAVYEGGVLRPLAPLALAESQHVLLTITNVPEAQADSSRAAEQEWIRLHGADFCGEWVALQGSELISHGAKARAVRDEARAKGVASPLMVHLPDEPGRPSAGWL